MKRLRFGLIAAAVILSVSGAYATKNNVKNGDTLYGVTGTDGNKYIVEAVSGSYSCDASSDVCTVESSVAPTNGEILMSETTSPTSGTYDPR